MAKRFNVTVSVSEKEREMFGVWAERRGISVSKWARNTLLEAVPADMRKHMLGTDPIEAAHTTSIAVQTGNAIHLVQEDAPAPRIATDPMVELMAAKRDTLHTCLYLKNYFMPGMTARDCIGTCSSERQTGRPCHWGAAVAPNCPAFRDFKPR